MLKATGAEPQSALSGQGARPKERHPQRPNLIDARRQSKTLMMAENSGIVLNIAAKGSYPNCRAALIQIVALQSLFIHPAQSIQLKSTRTTNAIERLNGEFRRRIKTQTGLPFPETLPILLWAVLSSGQITMRKVDGSQALTSLSNRWCLTSMPDQAQIRRSKNAGL